MEPVIVAVLVGIAVYIGVVALIPRHILAEQTKYTHRMLKKLEQENYMPAAQDSGDSIIREHIERANLITRAFITLPGAKMVYPRMIRAGLGLNADKFFLACLLILLLLVYGLKSFGGWGVVIAVAITYYIGWSYINSRVRKRNETFLNGFPDALDMIVRSVRSGYPLNAAVRMVADNMQPPISDEFKQVADETAFGSPLVGSLQRLAFRIDEPDIRFFVVVLSVQQEVGGNLAEVLSNLSGIIRRRKHLRMKVKAMTSEGRATAWVLSSLPVFVFVLLHFVAPDHLRPFFVSHFGNMLLAATVGIIALGVIIVRKMVNIRV